MKKLIAFALATCTVAAAGVTGAAADQPKHVGPFAGAIHADVTAQLKDGSTASAQLDRGKVTAVDAGSITILRPDGKSLTFSLAADSGAKVGDKVGILSQSGTAIRVRVGKKGNDSGSDAQQKAGAFKTAFHADITLLMKDGSSKSETMDRGKVTAVDAGSITILRPDNQSLTFSLSGDVAVREEGKDGSLDDIKVGDRLMVFATGGQAFLLRCISHSKAKS
jgi:hypothetical protein